VGGHAAAAEALLAGGAELRRVRLGGAQCANALHLAAEAGIPEALPQALLRCRGARRLAAARSAEGCTPAQAAHVAGTRRWRQRAVTVNPDQWNEQEKTGRRQA